MAWGAAQTPTLYATRAAALVRRGHLRGISWVPKLWRMRVDALGFYLTGAASDGAMQTDPDDSLGNFRSMTEIRALGALITDPIPPIVVQRVTGACGEGEGVIRGDFQNRLYYTPPGGTEGPAVTIGACDEQLLTGADVDKAVRISGVGHGRRFGSMKLEIVKAFNGALGMSNVTNGERVAGVNKYRGVMLLAHGAMDISSIKLWISTLGTQAVSDGGQLGAAGAGTLVTTGSLADWPEQGYCHIRTAALATREIVYYTSRTGTVLTVPAAGRGLLGTGAAAGAATDLVDAVPGIRIALETPAANKSIQTVANENTAPAAVVWDTGITSTTGLSVTSLATGVNHGLWIHEEIPAGATRTHEMENAINLQFVQGGVTYDSQLFGLYRVAGSAQYELYLGQDANPDFTAAADDTSAALPFSTALAPPGAGTREYRATCRYRNVYGLISINQYTRNFIIDAAGNQVRANPSAPENILLFDGDDFQVELRADNYYRDDGDDAADYWRIWITDDGSTPNPAVDTPRQILMKKHSIFERLFLRLGPYTGGATISVIVRAYRSSDGADDGGSTVYQHIVTAAPNTPASGRLFGGTVNEYR